jgi:hypothetical protein
MPRKTKRKTLRARRDKQPAMHLDFEKNAKHFAEEISDLGDRLSVHIDGIFGTGRGHEGRGGRRDTFGPLGPLVSSIVGLVFLLLALSALDIMNASAGIPFVRTLSSYLYSNLHWAFSIFLLFGYAEYFSKRQRKAYAFISPLVNAAGLVIMLYIAIWSLGMTGIASENNSISSLSNLIFPNLWNIFWIAAALGYVAVFSRAEED